MRYFTMLALYCSFALFLLKPQTTYTLTDEYLKLKKIMDTQYTKEGGAWDDQSEEGLKIVLKMMDILEKNKENTMEYYLALRDVGVCALRYTSWKKLETNDSEGLKRLELLEARGNKMYQDSLLGRHVLEGYKWEEAVLVRKAIDLEQNGKMEEAVKYQEEVVNKRPDVLKGFIDMYRLYYKSKLYDKYDKLFRKVHEKFIQYYKDYYFITMQLRYYEALNYYKDHDLKYHDQLIHDMFKTDLRKMMKLDMPDINLTEGYMTFDLYGYLYNWMKAKDRYPEERMFLANRLFADREDIRSISGGLKRLTEDDVHLEIITTAIQSRKGDQRKVFIEKITEAYLNNEDRYCCFWDFETFEKLKKIIEKVENEK